MDNFQSEFERMFQEFDNQAIFAYLKSFSRARVTFNSSKQVNPPPDHTSKPAPSPITIVDRVPIMS